MHKALDLEGNNCQAMYAVAGVTPALLTLLTRGTRGTGRIEVIGALLVADAATCLQVKRDVKQPTSPTRASKRSAGQAGSQGLNPAAAHEESQPRKKKRTLSTAQAASMPIGTSVVSTINGTQTVHGTISGSFCNGSQKNVCKGCS